MPTTLRLTEAPLPVYMTIGADDPFRITKDPIQELEYALELFRNWRFSNSLASFTRSGAVTQLLEACAEHVMACLEEPRLGLIHPYTAQLTIYFISALPAGLPDPECGVDKDGDLNLEWYGAGGHMLTISMNVTGRIAYAYLHGMEHEHGMVQMQETIPARLLDLIAKFSS